VAACPVCKAPVNFKCRANGTFKYGDPPVAKLAFDEIHVERKDLVRDALVSVRSV